MHSLRGEDVRKFFLKLSCSFISCKTQIGYEQNFRPVPFQYKLAGHLCHGVRNITSLPLPKETKFERGASTRQLFMLWSHNGGEARYERFVACLDIAQSGLSLFSPFLHATCYW